MSHYDNCRPGYCARCGAAPGNMINGVCEFCGPRKPQERRESSLSLERLQYLLKYSSTTGEFRNRVYRSSNAQAGQIAGTIADNGYIQLNIDGKFFYAHRLAIFYKTGRWPPFTVDHRDGNRANNRWRNIRPATLSENGQNQNLPGLRNSSGVLGVYWSKLRQRWVAQLVLDGKKVHVRFFKDKQLAERSYLNAKVRFHPYQTTIK